jgi:murein L,D-transpeptidase YcbB/YkuD
MLNASVAWARRRRSLAGLRGVVTTVVALVGATGLARADGGHNGWMPFPGGPGDSISAQPYDRAFVRNWEANPPRGFPTVSAANLAPTKAAIKRYAEIVERGGWKPLSELQLQAGVADPAVIVLRDRLLLSGDLKEQSGQSDQFDENLERALKRFQASNGLTPTGVLDKRTIGALNVPAETRLRQLRTNLARLQDFVPSLGKRYVVVNIPSAQVEAVENDRVVSRHSGVVGKLDRPTPLLRSEIHELNFNPTWTLPPTVIEKDLIPKGQEMQRNHQSVLEKYGIDAYGPDGKKRDPASIDWSSTAVRNLVYMQQPGKENPLGFLKINFPSEHSVYMHDTPAGSLFGRSFRAASSGCVRVQNIEQLAAWLLTVNGGWSAERIEQMRKTGERQDVRLKQPVPLYFVYMTAWATEDGVVQFRRDVYNKDGVGATASAY